MKRVTVHYSVPTSRGYSALLRVHEGIDVRYYYKDNVFVVDVIDDNTQFVYSLAWMSYAESFRGVADDIVRGA